MKIAALFVMENGPYYNLSNIDPWDEKRDAKKYKGPHPVIAHSPCQRWGRYWGGGPMLHGTEKQKLLGDDDGCFAHALWSVRTFGGVLEHPEASYAFKYYGLPIPKRCGGWTKEDSFGGKSCCVAQGYYGHRAQKLTWLYAVKTNYLNLIWGLCPNKQKIEESLSKPERSRLIKTGVCQRLSKNQRTETPIKFRDLLIKMIRE